VRVALCMMAAALAGPMAGCGPSPDYAPVPQVDYGYVRPFGYAPPRSGNSSSGAGTSKWDYYRNYRGSFHRGPESFDGS